MANPDADRISNRADKLAGVKQRTIRDIPSEQGLTGGDDDRPAAQAYPTVQERIRGGTDLGD